MSEQTGTANERIGQQAVDLAVARKQRDALLDALRQIASGAGEFTARGLARRAIEKVEGD